MPLPPGPEEPRVVQTLRWVYQPIAVMERCRRRYGRVFTMRLAGWPPMLLISDADLIKQIWRRACRWSGVLDGGAETGETP